MNPQPDQPRDPTSPHAGGRDLTDLCDRTVDEVYRYALRLTGGNVTATSDLVQDTYLALMRHLNRYPHDPVGLPWLITCCRHRFLDGLRSARRHEHYRRKAFERERHDHPGDQSALASSDTIAALHALTDVERAALVLRHVDGMPVAEVATELGRSVAATDSLLRRARDRFRVAYTVNRQPADGAALNHGGSS
jgi:RNA polymerase sigma-70 factor (ECF subfamily)